MKSDCEREDPMARVTTVVAITTVLLCGAAGAVLGSLFPIDALKRHYHAPPAAKVVPPVTPPADGMASGSVPSAPKETPAKATAVPPVATTTYDLASSVVPGEEPVFREERETPVSHPQPEVLADTNPLPPQEVEVEPADKRDVRSPPAPPEKTRRVKHARAATTATKKSRPAARSHARREDVAREEAPPKRSIISQLPFVGPVIGLMVP